MTASDNSKQTPGVAFVTGGRRGIGRAIAYSLADHGFDVVINDIARDESAEETLSGIRERGMKAAFVKGDIAQVDDHERLVSEAWDAFGPIGCLVNNAGVQTAYRGDMLDIPVESFDRLIGVNLRGSFFLTQRLAKRMAGEPCGETFDHFRFNRKCSGCDTGAGRLLRLEIRYPDDVDALCASPGRVRYCGA